MKKLLLTAIILLSAACSDPSQPFDAKQYLSELEGPKVLTIGETLLVNARSAQQQGEWNAAAQIYERLLEKDPKNIEILVALAECKRRTYQYDHAIALYDMALRIDKSLLDAKEGKGLAMLTKGDFETPIPLFEEVMKVDAKRWKTLNALGILFAARSMHGEAVQYFKQALDHSPGNTSIMNNMGLSYALAGEFSVAADTLIQAGALAVGNEVTRKRIDLNLALIYAISGKLEDARMIAELYYSGPELHNNLGLYAHLANDNAMSEAYLNMALTQSKTFYAKAWENLQEITTAGQNLPPSKPVELKAAPAAGGAAPAKRIKVKNPAKIQPEKKEPVSDIVGALE